jgi:cytochrome c
MRGRTAATILGVLLLAMPAHAEGNSARGARVFGACAACHALEPDRNMTGPSLAGLWNRKAGSLQSFARYSAALKSANVVWDDATLDAWLADPQQVIPGNQMTFRGIKDAQPRSDLLAYLKEATKPGGGSQPAQQPGGMMGGGSVPNLRKLDAEDRVQAISYCQDTYRVTTADGKTHVFWERNLRLKTDGSGDGPEKGAPALVGAGMMGDRADVIFADPAEISASIVPKC